MLRSPKVDERTAAQVAAQVRDLLPYYVPGWQNRDSGPAEALVRIFGRYCEIVIDRLNVAPEKNLLAFLDFLGAAPLPPQPARIPLTFYLAQKAPGATVPVRTQVAAKPSQGEKNPVIFETEEELQVTPAILDSLFVKDRASDAYADGSSLLAATPPGAGPLPVEGPTLPAFRGDKPIPHILYLGLKLPASKALLKTLRLSFLIDGPGASGRQAVWEAVKEVRELKQPVSSPSSGTTVGETMEYERFTVEPLNPSSDTTAGLTRSGDVVFESLTVIPEMEVKGVRSRWLRCRFVSPPKTKSAPDASPTIESRTLKSVTVHTEIERPALPIEKGFANAVPVDLSKEFLPFGPRPKLGDTLYLANDEAFSLTNATVNVHLELLNPAGENVPPPILPTQPRSTRLLWEFSVGENSWAALGTSALVRIQDERTDFSDGTDILSRTGEVRFKFPSLPQPATVNGQKKYWVRVRIVGGDYGEEAHWEPDPEKGYVVVPSSVAPPIVATVSVSYVIASDSAPGAVWGYEDFRYTASGSQGLKLFQPVGPGGPALYLGFAPAPEQTLESRPLTTYFGLGTAPAGKAAHPPSNSLAVVWESWSKSSRSWISLIVRDDTNGFRRSGLVALLAPKDFVETDEFGKKRYWLRVRRADSAGDFEPTLRLVLLNTIMAVQAMTTTNEVLGSSNGKPGQKFRTNHAPVLEGQALQVLEPTLPSVEAVELIASEEGEDAVSRLLNPFSEREEIWVRWHLVANFNASGPQSRHYVLDRVRGEVTFGDGENGRIPPVLPGNIRMTRYRSGGGAGGNKPPNSVAQLMTTLPYVERVNNLEAASGGADLETRADLADRAPRSVRHGRRAVTAEDFEDLAVIASPEVGRARCVPLRDLAADPTGEKLAPGVISLIVVPRSGDRKPLPSLGLLDRVRRFLDQHRLLTTDLVLVGPDYVAIRMEAELAIADPNAAGDVQQAATRELQRFLHPLTGGGGTGWHFGRLPVASDLYTLLEGIRGVSHVRRLSTFAISDRPGAEMTSRFLIYSSDKHEVSVSLEE